MSIVLRTSGATASVVNTIRARVAEIDANQPVYGVQSVEQVMSQSIAPWRMYSSLLSAFAGLAVVLAALGIHAVIAATVVDRRNEIGIRMALGAQRSDVLVMMFREASVLVVMGLGIGLVGALLGSRAIKGWLFGISANDPATYGAVCVAIGLISLIAVYRPVRRATRVDPLVALRAE